MEFFTADICDEHSDKVHVLDDDFKNYGAKKKFCAQVKTIKLDKNNSDLVKLLRDEDGTGLVVVVDVDKEYFAVVGENLMKFAKDNDWAGIVINGYVRDIEMTSQIDVALLALGTCPRKSFKESAYQENLELNFADVTFVPGDYLYADVDGIITSKTKLV